MASPMRPPWGRPTPASPSPRPATLPAKPPHSSCSSRPSRRFRKRSDWRKPRCARSNRISSGPSSTTRRPFRWRHLAFSARSSARQRWACPTSLSSATPCACEGGRDKLWQGRLGKCVRKPTATVWRKRETPSGATELEPKRISFRRFAAPIANTATQGWRRGLPSTAASPPGAAVLQNRPARAASLPFTSLLDSLWCAGYTMVPTQSFNSMKRIFLTTVVSLLVLAVNAADSGKSVPISDAITFAGWDGDTNKTWRIEDGAFVGGSLKATVPENEFIATTRSFTNFVLRLKFKLTGTEGFINGGVQIRSERTKNPPNEMSGYQVDMGDPEWWGCLYDESRRNKVVAKSDLQAINKVLNRQDWNEYMIRAEGKRIRAWINGVPTVDYTEPDDGIPQFGQIGLQVHGGGKTEAWYKEIRIEELP